MPRERAVAPADADARATLLRSDPNTALGPRLAHALYGALWLAGGVVTSPLFAWRGLREPAFRRMLRERFDRSRTPVPPRKSGATRRVLVHAVSVGEVKGARSIVAAIEAAEPEAEVVVSATTDTGLAVARESYPGHGVERFPADVTGVVERFLERVRPDVVVLFELELWPAFLRACNRRGIPVCVANGRITERSFERFRWLERVFPQLNRVSLYCAQTDEYAARFSALGVSPERIVVTGNVKNDALPAGPVDVDPDLRRLVAAGDGRPIFVAGSTHVPEERTVARAWRACAHPSRLVLVPRHPPRCPEVTAELAGAGIGHQLWSSLRGGEPPDPAVPLVVDAVGLLEDLYGLADLAFVGGSLIERGGHNVLEPAAQGRPVLVGPHVQNFRHEAGLLAAAGASRTVEDEARLAEALDELLGDAVGRRAMGEAGAAVVARERGATGRTIAAFVRVGLLAGAAARPRN